MPSGTGWGVFRWFQFGSWELGSVGKEIDEISNLVFV